MRPDQPKIKPQPTLTAEAEAERAARQAREATALRENLRRRKAQSRAREAVPDTPADPKPCG